MMQSGFLSEEDRKALTVLARDGSSPCRVSRRANALVLLDKGWSCQQVADALLLDDDTIRGWRKLFEQRGIEGITSFDVGGSASYLSVKQEDDLKTWVGATLPRSTRQIGAWIEKEFGLVYESRSGLIALLHRLGLEYHKPSVIPRKLDKEKQKAFIESYDDLLNSLADNEAVLFADAVHPTHAARPAGCWAPSQEKLAIEQTSGRQRINIHGAINLETGQTRIIEALTIEFWYQVDHHNGLTAHEYFVDNGVFTVAGKPMNGVPFLLEQVLEARSGQVFFNAWLSAFNDFRAGKNTTG